MRPDSIAIFDVDSHEMSLSPGHELCPRPRMEPLSQSLAALYELAAQKEIPLVFTTCCSGRMPDCRGGRDLLYIPMDGDDTAWEHRVGDHRTFYLAKPAFGTPALNLERRAFDVFLHNANAPRLIELLGISSWIVFGNGLDLCVHAVVEGLLAAGVKVSVIADVLVSSAMGNDETKRKRLADWNDLGVSTPALGELLQRLERS